MTTFRPHRPRLAAIPTRIGQGLAVTALMAGLAIGASAAGDPAIACAEPQEWDIGAFDKCTNRVDQQWLSGQIPDANLVDAYKDCCLRTGGVWSASLHACVAPPANSAAPRVMPSGAPKQTLTPVPPPVVGDPGSITQTFDRRQPVE